MLREGGLQVKRDADFALPRACKRPRTSVSRARNPCWEPLHRPRRAVSPSDAHCSQDAAAILEIDEEAAEIVKALLELGGSMNSAEGLCGPRTVGSSPNSPHDRVAARKLGKASPGALHLQSNTLKTVPTIIITSGNSTDTGHGEAKSISSDAIDGVSSKGQSGSPSSAQASETVLHGISSKPRNLTEAQTAIGNRASDDTSWADPGSSLAGPFSQDPSQQNGTPVRMGHTVSTGISLPSMTQVANKQIKQESAPQQDQPVLGRLSPECLSQARNLQTQLALQQVLHSRLAARSHNRPIANTRGGKLIVLPDLSQQGGASPFGPHRLQNLTPLATNKSPARIHNNVGEAKTLTLSRVPTLVLSAVQKPSRSPRPITPPLPLLPSATPIKSEVLEPALKFNRSKTLTSQELPLLPAQSCPGKEEIISDTNIAVAATQGNSGCSSDESGEEDWLPNWSLNLYNALNPTVITTGQPVMAGRTASQSLEAKPAASAR